MQLDTQHGLNKQRNQRKTSGRVDEHLDEKISESTSDPKLILAKAIEI